MRTFFANRPRPILGMDINPSAVKFIEISKTKTQYRVERYGFESMPSNAMDGYRIKDLDALAFSIKKIINKHSITGKAVALAVPDAFVITKMVQVSQRLTEEEMEAIISLEAEKFIPYPLNEIHLDFEIKAVSLNKPETFDVLIVASRSEHIKSRVDSIRRAGLQVKLIDVESFARACVGALLIEEFNPAHANASVAIIDIGFHFSLLVLRGKHLVFTREESLGQIPRIKDNEVYSKRIKVSSKDQNQAFDAAAIKEMESLKQSLFFQIKRNLQFYYSSFEDPLELILLAGDFARMPGLANLIQTECKISTKVSNPFLGMSIHNKIDSKALTTDAPSLLLACGLALRAVG